MATRRMRIKATINVPRGGGPKTESQQPAPPLLDDLSSPSVVTSPLSVENKALSPAFLPPTSPSSSLPPASPRSISGPASPATPLGHSGSIDSGGGGLGLIDQPFSPGVPPRINTPPIPPPSSPHSPAPSHSLALVTWQQRPSPSKSPAGLPPSGSIIRRSPSPALARLTNSPGPAAPPSPVFSRTTNSPGPPSTSLVLSKWTNSPGPSHPHPPPAKKRVIIPDPESKEKEAAQQSSTRFATARKEFYDKLQSGQVPERNKMTMLHFTFYNPPNPNKKNLPGQRKSRSRASSVCSDISTISKQEPPDDNMNPPNNENMGKASSAPSSIAGSRRTTASSTGSHPASEGGHSEAGSVASNASSNGSVPGPRVKVGPDGKLIIDEKSLLMETSESQRAKKQIEDMEVVSGAEYAVGSSGFYRYKKNYRRGNEWSEKETVRFYRALNQCGTDFSMMEKLFPFRTRHELKSKFKREDRKNSDLISKVLSCCVFDPDEPISSDEEEGDVPGKNLAAEKEKLIERNETEQVVCCSKEVATVGKRKRVIKKEKDMKFTPEQLEEMKTNIHKGAGTGKGRKWNTPVQGLVGGKLPPTPTTTTSQCGSVL